MGVCVGCLCVVCVLCVCVLCVCVVCVCVVCVVCVLCFVEIHFSSAFSMDDDCHFGGSSLL